MLALYDDGCGSLLLKKKRDLNQLGEGHNIGELLPKQETGCNCGEGHVV